MKRKAEDSLSEHKRPSRNGFEFGEKIGSGSYGDVRVGRKDGIEYAVKFFGYTSVKPDVEWILREIDNLQHLREVSGVAQIVASFFDSGEGLIPGKEIKFRGQRFPVIVMEKLNGGELFHRLTTATRKYSERDASIIFHSFVKALCEVHDRRNMINMDLKVENLVFKEKDGLEVKIIDFGMAVHLWDRDCHIDNPLPAPKGTPLVMAPETILYHRKCGQGYYSKASDIWQAGCILYTLLTGRSPFRDQTDIVNGVFTVPLDKISRSLLAVDLLRQTLHPDWRMRITAANILRHPWIANIERVPVDDLGSSFRVSARNYALQRRLQQAWMQNIETISGRRQKLCEAVTNISSIDSCDFSPDDCSVTPRGDFSTSECCSESLPASAAATSTLSASSTTSSCLSAAASGFVLVLSRKEIRKLKHLFITAALRLPADAGPPSDSVEHCHQVLSFGGLDYGTFIEYAGGGSSEPLLPLAKEEVCHLLDWDENGHIDYFEGLFSLSFMMLELDEHFDQNKVADIYFDIFDIFDSGSVAPEIIKRGLEILLTNAGEDINAVLEDFRLQGSVNRASFHTFFKALMSRSQCVSNAVRSRLSL